MKNQVAFGDYQGFKVSVNEWGTFNAKIDGTDIVADTYLKLKEEIDQTLKNKQKAKRKVMSIKVVNSELKTATVTGVHARLGTLTMTPKLECRRYGGSSVWLDCEPAKKLLTEKRAAEGRIRQIEKELEAFQIKTDHDGYSEVKTDDEYDRLVAELEECAASATKAAEKVVKP